MAIFLFVLTLCVTGVVLFFVLRSLGKRALGIALSRTLLLIKVPQEVPKEGAQKDVNIEIGKFEQLLANLGAQRKPFSLEIAVHHIGEEIHFYLAVPRSVSEVAVKQVQSLWSGASVEHVSGDYNIFNPQGAVAAAYLTQKENYAIPLRTYREIEADTFESVAGAFAKIGEVGEGAALQLILEPASKDAKKTIEQYVKRLKKGEDPEKVLRSGSVGIDFSDVREALAPESKEKREEKERGKVVDDEMVKALEAKLAKPLFRVNIRIIAAAPSPFQANDILDGILAGFEQFSAPRRNVLRAVKPKNLKNIIYEFSFRNFSSKETMVLSTEEIAGMYHLPTATMETPRLKILKSKEAPPPTNLPKQGVPLGESVFRGQREAVYLADDDRRRHMYVIGQTGTGKSTFMSSMIIDDVRRGKGVAVIDPHGEFAEGVLEHVPPERMKDVIYFDPSDLWRPMGLNMLDYNFDRPEEKTFIVNEMQSIFNKLFTAETMGPMFEQYMRNALLLLMEDMPNEPATLIEIPRVFTDSEYRRRKLSRIKNPVVIDFWEKEAVKAGGEASLANMTPYITSKFNNFIANDYMRPIIGQPKSAFNFRDVMDSGKILLVNLAKGKIGDINMGLLGMVIIGKILMAALSRVDTPQESRKDFYLYIDEFQNFATDAVSTILSEARKYRLDLIIAHQFIAQLDEKIRDAVFGNVGTQIVFRVGVQDAEFLVKQFEPIFNQNDLMNIDNFHAYAKLLIHGETSKPFSVKTFPVTPGKSEQVSRLKEYGRETYGADRKDVEEKIFERLRS